LIHNGQQDGDKLGATGLCHEYIPKKKVHSWGVGFLPIEEWEIPGEGNMENFSEGITDPEDEEDNSENVKEESKKSKEDSSDEDRKDNEEDEGDDEDANRIAHGWISFARAEQEEESHGFMLAIAPKEKPKTPLSKTILSKRLKQNEILNWHYQDTSKLNDCTRCGTFMDWFDGLASHILTLKEGHDN